VEADRRGGWFYFKCEKEGGRTHYRGNFAKRKKPADACRRGGGIPKKAGGTFQGEELNRMDLRSRVGALILGRRKSIRYTTEVAGLESG